MTILLDKVRIHSFRAIKNIEVALSSTALLVGANNSGKTSFLRALNLALGTSRRQLSKEDFNVGKNERLLPEKKIIVDVRFVPQPTGDGQKEALTFNEKWIGQFGENISVDGNDREYFAFRTQAFLDPVISDFRIEKFVISDWQEDFDGWQEKQYTAKLGQASSALPFVLIDAQRDVLADLRDRTSFLGKLTSSITFSQEVVDKLTESIQGLNDEIVTNSDILKTLQSSLEDLSSTVSQDESSIRITPLNNNIQDLNRGLNIKFEEADTESFPLEYHGMGTRSWATFLCLKAFLNWKMTLFADGDEIPYFPVLALEEPESHLHPNGQRHLYRQISELPGQKLITTHSCHIVGSTDLLELRHFRKQGNEVTVSALNLATLTTDGLRKIKREVLNTRGELLFSKALVLFEGETEEVFLPIIAKEYWGRYPSELGITFVGVAGQNYGPFLQLCKDFQIPFYIFSDADGKAKSDLGNKLEAIFGKKLEEFDTIFFCNDGCHFEKQLSQFFLNECKLAMVRLGEIQLENSTFDDDRGRVAAEKSHDARRQEILGMPETEVLDFMQRKKTRFSPVIAEIFVKLEDKAARVPDFLKPLLHRISDDLRFPIEQEND